MILVCIDDQLNSREAFKAGHPFVVNILNKNQKEDYWTGLVKNVAYDDQGEPLLFSRGQLDRLTITETL